MPATGSKAHSRISPSLTPQARDALVMRAFQGLAYEEIGDRLAISPGAARQAVFEAQVGTRAERARP